MGLKSIEPGASGRRAGRTCHKLIAMKQRTFFAALVVLGGSAAAISQPATPESKPDAPAAAYATQTVCEGLEVPWAIAFLPGDRGDMLITERPGRVRLYKDGRLVPAPVLTVPNVMARTGMEVGLMGLCLHPDFSKNGWVYLAYGHTEGDIRIARYKYSPSKAGAKPGEIDPGEFTEETILLRGIAAGPNHAGCRVKFGPDGKLYITTGEMFKRALAQDMTSLNGKILRINDDGSIPSDNPFVGDEFKAKGTRPEIWSSGHRNPQGLAWQSGTGVLFETEHGPSGEVGSGASGQGGDELNIITKGQNYGWPVIHHDQTKEGMESPLTQWSPSVAPASVMVYSGSRFPAWKDSVFVGALGGLGGQKKWGIIRLTVGNGKVASQEVLATGFGRIREVTEGPDGAIYFTTSNRDGRAQPKPGDDRIIRLTPAS